MRSRRFAAVLLALAALASACATGGVAGRSGVSDVALESVASSPREKGPSALDDPGAPGLPAPAVDLSEIISGGPPPDGIPPIDEPRFQKASEVDWVEDREPILALEIGGDARAYPIQILTWHEIVNDTVGGIPVALTFCPLCNSAVALDRRLGDRVLDFGTSGSLYRSALVMYDRQTESLWSHFTGQAIAGTLTGSELDFFPVSTVSWSEWRRAHPDGWVLSRRTGFDRPYGRNPYSGYDEPKDRPFLFRGDPDPRLPPKTRVIGIRMGKDSAAVVADSLRRRKVIDLELGDRNLVVWMKPGAASALDTGEIADGRDVGSTGVFEATIDGRRLSFSVHSGGFTDIQTRTRWDILGRGVSGELSGRKLVPVEHVDTFWFAWAAFQPETRLVRG